MNINNKINAPAKTKLSAIVAALVTVGVQPVMVSNVNSAAYVFAGEVNGEDIITHPAGYTGAGGNVVVNVCVVPGTANATAMEVSVQNSINVWNALASTTPNLQSANVPAGQIDFESVLLHEVGHCIGEAHTNLGAQTGVTGVNTDFTNSTDGANNTFTFNDGADNVIGSGDDVRGDDANLHWFNMANNDPFLLQPITDSSTFSRDLSDLPTGDLFAANGARAVSLALGYGQTEAVMNQGTNFGEAQRTLAADDVHGINLAKSGVDEVQGTGDDYNLTLNYLGISNSNNCDINIQFDVTAGFAFCSVGGTFVGSGGDHVSITTANIFFDTDAVTWFFNQTPNNTPPPAATCDGLPATVDLNLGQVPTPGPDVIVGTPAGETINGLGGDDVICGMGGFDIIMGGSGNDIIYGGDENGVDTAPNDLFGGTGDDFIIGSQLDDFLFGNSGEDFLETNNTTSNPDFLWGGSGNDELISNSVGGSTMRGQGNNDIMTGSQSADTMRGDPGLDTIFGRNGNDDISGGNGADSIFGGAGHDILAGNNNRDTILGQNGNDTITGGLGNDTMNGGNGTDSCNGQGQTGGAGDTAANCETVSGVPFAGSSAGVTSQPSRRTLTEREVDLLDRCNLSIEECLAGKR